MAADPTFAPILLGMGVDELSMGAVAIPRVKQVIRGLRLSECQRLFEDVVKQSTLEGVEAAMRRHQRRLEHRTTHRS